MQRIIITTASALAFASVSGASILNWESHPGLDWTPGDLGPGTYTVDGVDITVTVAGAPSIVDGPFAGGGTLLPDDDNPFGFSGFWTAGDFPGALGDDVITINISFSTSVTGVSFEMFDIDGVGGSAEFVNVVGSLMGSGVAIDSVTTGSAIDYDGVSMFASNGGDDQNPPSDPATAAVLGFGGAIDNIEFAFSANGANRGFLIGDIEFVPAPGAAALLGLGGLAAARRRR